MLWCGGVLLVDAGADPGLLRTGLCKLDGSVVSASLGGLSQQELCVFCLQMALYVAEDFHGKPKSQ